MISDHSSELAIYRTIELKLRSLKRIFQGEFVSKNLSSWADALTLARKQVQSRPQLSHEVQLSRAEAYTIQELGIEHRIHDKENVVGYKMGLTSEAKRQQMNLDSPLYGVLTDRMQIENKGTFSLKNSIHAKIEPEVAFLISQDLKGKVTREDVLRSCTGVCACLEILDSRYDHFKYFSMEDVIADNSSSSYFVHGPWVTDFKKMDLINLKMKMKVNGVVAQEGISKDISGDPVQSVIQLCELLAERNRHLPARSIVLAGAATTAVNLEDGQHIELEVDSLEPVHIHVKG